MSFNLGNTSGTGMGLGVTSTPNKCEFDFDTYLSAYDPPPVARHYKKTKHLI